MNDIIFAHFSGGSANTFGSSNEFLKICEPKMFFYQINEEDHACLNYASSKNCYHLNDDMAMVMEPEAKMKFNRNLC